MIDDAARLLVVVKPMLKAPVDATKTFPRSAGVAAAKLVTATVPPIFGREPVADATSRATPLLLVDTEKVPAD